MTWRSQTRGHMTPAKPDCGATNPTISLSITRTLTKKSGGTQSYQHLAHTASGTVKGPRHSPESDTMRYGRDKGTGTQKLFATDHLFLAGSKRATSVADRRTLARASPSFATMPKSSASAAASATRTYAADPIPLILSPPPPRAPLAITVNRHAC